MSFADPTIIGHKLYWYTLGGGVSERQWNDALNVVKIQGKSLDFDYLKRICASRGLLDIYHKFIAATGLSSDISPPQST